MKDSPSAASLRVKQQLPITCDSTIDHTIYIEDAGWMFILTSSFMPDQVAM